MFVFGFQLLQNGGLDRLASNLSDLKDDDFLCSPEIIKVFFWGGRAEKLKHLLVKGKDEALSSGLVVMGDDSFSRGRGFISWHRILQWT